MSTTILAAAINILATVLPMLGVNIGTEALTTTVATLATIGTALWIWYRRATTGDVDLLGRRKA